MNSSATELPVLSFRSKRSWETWIEKHLSTRGLWLKLAKKHSSVKTLNYADALEVALCYGWIDGQKKALDEQYWLQRFGPRGPKSIWSRINRSKAEELIRRGRMRPPGLAAIERAKSSGQWDRAYEPQRSAEPPEDFMKELNAREQAKAFFNSLDSRNRYAILFRLHAAGKAETRRRRIEKFIGMLERHEKIYP